jgi:hypothetical protein
MDNRDYSSRGGRETVAAQRNNTLRFAVAMRVIVAPVSGSRLCPRGLWASTALLAGDWFGRDGDDAIQAAGGLELMGSLSC